MRRQSDTEICFTKQSPERADSLHPPEKNKSMFANNEDNVDYS